MSIQIQPLVLAVTLLFTCSLGAVSQAAPPTHDGVYLQLSGGLGLPHLSIAADDHGTTTKHYADTESDRSFNLSLLLGWQLRPGLAFGVGGIYLAYSPNPQPTENGQPYGQVDVKQPYVQGVDMLGPFVDLYPSPRLGWHVQALVGYAQTSFAEITPNPFDAGLGGIGLMAGLGHDWWVSEHWSIGVLARLTYANMSLGQTSFPDYDQGWQSEHTTMISPSLDASFTFH